MLDWRISAGTDEGENVLVVFISGFLFSLSPLGARNRWKNFHHAKFGDMPQTHADVLPPKATWWFWDSGWECWIHLLTTDHLLLNRINRKRMIVDRATYTHLRSEYKWALLHQGFEFSASDDLPTAAHWGPVGIKICLDSSNPWAECFR